MGTQRLLPHAIAVAAPKQASARPSSLQIAFVANAPSQQTGQEEHQDCKVTTKLTAATTTMKSTTSCGSTSGLVARGDDPLANDTTMSTSQRCTSLADRMTQRQQYLQSVDAQPQHEQSYTEDCLPTGRTTTPIVSTRTTKSNDADHGKASPPDASGISQREAALRAYLAACALLNRRHARARIGNSSCQAAAAVATTTDTGLATIDRQREHMQRHMLPHTTSANNEVAIDTAYVEGGLYNARPQDNLNARAADGRTRDATVVQTMAALADACEPGVA